MSHNSQQPELRPWILGVCDTGDLDAFISASAAIHYPNSGPGRPGSSVLKSVSLLPGWREEDGIAEDAFCPPMLLLVGHWNGRGHADSSPEFLGCLTLFHSYRQSGWDPREHVLFWKPQFPVFPKGNTLKNSFEFSGFILLPGNKNASQSPSLVTFLKFTLQLCLIPQYH